MNFFYEKEALYQNFSSVKKGLFIYNFFQFSEIGKSFCPHNSLLKNWISEPNKENFFNTLESVTEILFKQIFALEYFLQDYTSKTKIII